jgi:hypothetical protein
LGLGIYIPTQSRRFGTRQLGRAFGEGGRAVCGSRAIWVFAVAVLICGLVYWWFADWRAYVDDPSGAWPKFVMPWWWQVIESGIVGLLAGGLLAGVWELASCTRSCRTERDT